MSDSEHEAETSVRAIVLDIFPNGRSSDGRAGYDREPLAYALGTRDFRLFEVVFSETPDVAIDDEVPVEPQGDTVKRVRNVEFDDLSSGAQSEIEYVVAEVVEADEDRFVSFYNDAQPITLRLHQLNLLPGIGKKLRNGILDERKRKPFASFEDLEERVAGLHDPDGVLVERILEELRDDDLKYKAFVGRSDE
jgi:putative nucleotide binding protein